MEFLELVQEYKKAIEEARRIGEEIGRRLCETLKSLLPGIDFSISHWESNVICLWCESRDVIAFRIRNNLKPGELSQRAVSLINVIESELPELIDHVEAPHGIYLWKEEVESVRAALRSLRERTS